MILPLALLFFSSTCHWNKDSEFKEYRICNERVVGVVINSYLYTYKEVDKQYWEVRTAADILLDTYTSREAAEKGLIKFLGAIKE